MIDQTLHHIRSEVKAKGWTPAELARRAEVSWATVSDIESDGWSPTVKTLRKIEQAIGLSAPQDAAPSPSPRRPRKSASEGAAA